MIGSLSETQEVLDFCQDKGIYPEIEEICSENLDHVYALLKGKNDSAKRYVLNVGKSILFWKEQFGSKINFLYHVAASCSRILASKFIG